MDEEDLLLLKLKREDLSSGNEGLSFDGSNIEAVKVAITQKLVTTEVLMNQLITSVFVLINELEGPIF